MSLYSRLLFSTELLSRAGTILGLVVLKRFNRGFFNEDYNLLGYETKLTGNFFYVS